MSSGLSYETFKSCELTDPEVFNCTDCLNHIETVNQCNSSEPSLGRVFSYKKNFIKTNDKKDINRIPKLFDYLNGDEDNTNRIMLGVFIIGLTFGAGNEWGRFITKSIVKTIHHGIKSLFKIK